MNDDTDLMKRQIELLEKLPRQNEERAKEVYDLVIPLGMDCRCGTMLRDMGLHEEALPLDLVHNFNEVNTDHEKLSGYHGFAAKMDLITHHFRDFLQVEDYEIFQYPVRTDFHWVCGHKKYGLFFYHLLGHGLFDENKRHLPISPENLIEAFPAFRKKYEERIARFRLKMHRSRKVLIVHMEGLTRLQATGSIGRHLDEEVVLRKAREVQEAYPGQQIDYLFFEHHPQAENQNMEKHYLSDRILRIRSNHSSTVKEFIVGGATISVPAACAKILSKIKLNDALFPR